MTAYTALSARHFGLGKHSVEGIDLDPGRDLHLTDDERSRMAKDAVDHLVDEADRLLAPYGALMLGNLETVAPVDRVCELEDDRGEITEALGEVDFDAVLQRYFDLSAEHEDG